MTPDGQVRIDALLEHGQPELLEPCDLGLRERLVSQVRERRPAPECKRVPKLARGRARVAPPRLIRQPLEAGQVELGRLDLEHVAGCPCSEPPIAELLAQPGDVDLDALGTGGRRGGPPQLVDQAVSRDELVRLEQKDRQERTLLDPAERERAITLDHLQWAQEPKVHTRVSRPYHAP